MAAEFVPANELEKALLAAHGSPAARPAFFQTLLTSDVFFLTPQAPATEGARTLAADTEVSFLLFDGPNGPYVPFFSSRARVEEVVQKMKSTLGFLGLAGRDAFGLLAQRGGPAVLNPGFACGKQFVPEEIRRLADGNTSPGEVVTIAKSTSVLLGQPSEYPQALVDALRTFFTQRPSVEAAYLGQIHDPASALPPHAIIGIVCSDYAGVVVEAGAVAQAATTEPVPIDFIQVGSRSKEGVQGYLRRETQPFYERRATAKPWWKVW